MQKLLIIIIILFAGLPVYAADIPYGNNPDAGKYATINGIKLYYEIYGQGAPLVLIHGNGGSIADMSAQIARFSKEYQVIVADSRGHGKSGLGSGQLTYMQMMKDWKTLLDQLHIKKARIFGWSDGGILGLLLAIHAPEKVGRLAIMGANLRPDETAIHPWTKPMLAGALDQVNAMIRKKDSSRNWELDRQLLNLVMRQPNIAVKSLHDIKIPVLVMAGDRDVIKGEHTLEIFQNLANAHLAILPGNTHFAPVTTPDMFNGLLRDFFDRPFTKPSTRDIMAQYYN